MILHSSFFSYNASMNTLPAMLTDITVESKIRGCLWGIVIGDALGAPVEGYSAEKIAELHTRVTEYKQPIGHKWFDNQPLGFWTDDTHLSFAVIKGLLAAEDFDMDAIAEQHAIAMGESTDGWGYSTQESIRNLKNGMHWSKSGITEKPHRGTGNGVPMKIAPLAAWSFLQDEDHDVEKIIQFAAMSHYTEMAAYAALAHHAAIYYCLAFQPNEFEKDEFLDDILVKAFWEVTHYINGEILFAKILDPPLNKTESRSADVLQEKLDLLFNNPREFFEKGGCYLCESLPFTYAYFLHDPTIDGFYDVINAGGDTDTNGSMFAAMLGALHGIKVFPQELIDGIQEKTQLEELIEKFIEKFVI